MRMNHVNIAVDDVAKARAFLETYFDLKCVVEPEGNSTPAVLIDEAKSIVTLSNFTKASEVVYPAGFHVGFMQPSREDVDAIFSRLQAGGYQPKRPREFHGAWTFYLQAPGGFMVEVGHQYAWPSEAAA